MHNHFFRGSSSSSSSQQVGDAIISFTLGTGIVPPVLVLCLEDPLTKKMRSTVASGALLLVLLISISISTVSALARHRVSIQSGANLHSRAFHRHQQDAFTYFDRAPVYLNDYLPDRAAEGRAAARVDLPDAPGNVSMGEAGYITFNATYNSTTFYWFFPSQDGNAAAPLLMWMNGSPHSSRTPYLAGSLRYLFDCSRYLFIDTAARFIYLSLLCALG